MVPFTRRLRFSALQQYKCSNPRHLCSGSPTVVPVKHFLNLSNGIEAVAGLRQAGLPLEQISFVRIQSSHLEKGDRNAVLANLDHNLLLHLALGFDCRIYDYGSRSANGVPRALWYGLEWSRYALSRLWMLEPQTPMLRGSNVQERFAAYVRDIPTPLRRRLKYYRTYVACTELRLRGACAKTEFDGKQDVYRGMMLDYLAAASEAQAEGPPPPEPEAMGMQWDVLCPPNSQVEHIDK